ncbi:MAG: phosphoadenylyl-sulfate reductase [Proteobacteria bacterium]|nr:phosphoadenylyl-sulfate reductase [Pseudomonadota bacterium]
MSAVVSAVVSTASAIARHARKTPGFDARVAHSLAVLRQAAAEHPGTIVQASSLGVEGIVITDLIARHALPIAIATLDTGTLHAETIELIGRIEARYARSVEVYRPVHESVVHFVGRNGSDAMYESVALRKACCRIRKLEPMARMLDGRSAWITGLRREQSEHRSEVSFREADDAGRAKIIPIADWTEADVWHYVAVHDVPYNPLHDEFYPSIGCAPCTRAVSLGEDSRAGRWWWEGEALKECGLHDRKATPLPAAA